MFLEELRPGRYRQTSVDYGPYSSQVFGPPTQPDPYFKRGTDLDENMTVGQGYGRADSFLFSPKPVMAPGRFSGHAVPRSTAGFVAEPESRFNKVKGGLGEYDKAKVFPYLTSTRPEKNLFPPGDRERTAKETFIDMVLGGSRGALINGPAEIAGTFQPMGDYINKLFGRDVIPESFLANSLPTQKSAEKWLVDNLGPYLNPDKDPIVEKVIREGAQTSQGKAAQGLGAFAPYTALGGLGAAIGGVPGAVVGLSVPALYRMQMLTQ